MSLLKLLGWAGVVFVLYIVLAHPTNAADVLNNLLGDLRNAADSLIIFLRGAFRA